MYAHDTPIPQSRLHPLRAGLIFVGLAGLSLMLITVGQGALYIVVATMATCVALPAWARWQRGRFDAFASDTVIGGYYVVAFGLGAIWTVHDPDNVAFDGYIVPFILQAALYSLFGVAAMLAGFNGPWFRPRERRVVDERIVSSLFLLVPGVLGLAGLIASTQLFWIRHNVPLALRTLGQFSPLFLYIWAAAWLLVLSGKATRAQKRVLFFVLIPGTGIVALTSMSDKSLMLSLGGMPLVALWYARRRLPWKTLVVLLLVLIFVIFPLFNTFRVLDKRIPFSMRAQMTADAIAAWDSQDYLDRSLSAFKRRLAAINSLAIAIRDVPRWVPYRHGATIFFPTVAFFVPRVIWPDKPETSMGRDFGETFRVVSALDDTTNVAVTVPGELFWNFDLPGIVVGMLLWGVVMRLLYRRYAEGDAMGPVRHAVHIVLLIQFVHFGGGLAPEIVGVVRTLIMVEGLRWVALYLGWLRQAPTSDAAAGANA